MPGNKNKFTRRESRNAGEQFLQYLKDTERGHIENKEELRTIYIEFKNGCAERTPNFSNAMYALRVSRKAQVTPEKIIFEKNLRHRTISLPDQYWPLRRDNKQEPYMPVGNYTKGQARQVINWIKQNRSEFINEKNKIHINSDYDLDNGRIRLRLSPGETKIFPISIENQSEETVIFYQYKALRNMRVFSFHDEHAVSQTNTFILHPGARYVLNVRCFADSYGYYPITIAFEFMTEKDKENRIIIGRFLSAVCSSKLADDLAPTSNYVPYQKNLRKPIIRHEDEGVPPDNTMRNDLEREMPLNEYKAPSYLKQSIKSGDFTNRTPVQSSHVKDKDLLTSSLDFNNYHKKFSLMLHLEEIQMDTDIRKYDQKDQKMEVCLKDKRLLVMNIPGVAENRPSVLRGDHLFVTVAADRGKPEVISYKGYVHGVELERVRLGFSSNLLRKFINGMQFDVEFTYNRLPLKVMHRAVNLANENHLKEILFPSDSYNHSIVDVQKLSLFDRNLESNPEQCNAVKQIVSGVSRPAPYLIFGPPGTGKTITLVEAIKQIVKHIPGSHALACAPSNSAADLLCQRLLKNSPIQPREIYRIVASSRDFRLVPEDIKVCCNWDSINKSYSYPSKLVLQQYKVIIVTLITAARLVSANFPPGHFTHVFIDESGHAVEPECVTAVAGILDVMDRETNKNGGMLVLAGDPKQLGPILRSPVAIEHGLNISLLERLMTQNPLYQKNDDGFNSQFVTKLLKNYRSHPDILTIPNDLFYDNELIIAADKMVTHSYCTWEHLPRKGFPIIFHGVLGKDEREGNSPSFFNVSEIEEIINYLELLLRTQAKKGLAKISPKEIGIITPYRKQVEKIRKALDLKLNGVTDIKDLKVGSVEEFQGQERRVILISTVRSAQDYVKLDEEFSLGFLKNPKRFNVAITRAKALLILVGNPIILSQDPNWARFLNFCTDRGGYKGFAYKEDSLDENDLTQLLGSLHIDGPPAVEETGESIVQQQNEPGWRHEH